MSSARRGRWLVWHPLAFAAWPVLNLWHQNVGVTPLTEALRAVVVVMAGALIVTAILSLVLRDARRGALAGSVVVLAVMLYGPFRQVATAPNWPLVVWLLAALVLMVGAVLAGSVVGELTTIAAGIGATVVVFAAVPILPQLAPLYRAWTEPPAEHEDLDALVGDWSPADGPRDIFYLVFDRYGSQASMERRWNFDLSGFFDDLQRRGFVVTPDSKGNHLRTAQSLSSTLNLRYHHDLSRRYGTDTGNMLPIYQLLQDHAVGRLLRARGYEYVHIGAWWDPTQDNPNADVSRSYEAWSDFERTLFRSTLVSVVERHLKGVDPAEASRRLTYDGAKHQFMWVREAANRPGPTFTFAHILLPHEPFVFDRNGNYVSADEEEQRGRERNYREQTEYTNVLIRALLDDLLDRPEDQLPVIVLSADEGPNPVRFIQEGGSFDWTQATDAELYESLSILNAYFLPGVEDPGLYRSISPVNTWRVLFNAYFGAALPLLEDRSYVFRDEDHVYDFHDVTDRLRGAD